MAGLLVKILITMAVAASFWLQPPNAEAVCSPVLNKYVAVLAALYNDCLLVANNPDANCRKLCSAKGYSGIHCCKHYDYMALETDECWCGASIEQLQGDVGNNDGEDNLWRYSTDTLVAPIGDDLDEDDDNMMTPIES